jgi:hypothetical protein
MNLNMAIERYQKNRTPGSSPRGTGVCGEPELERLAERGGVQQLQALR